MWEKRWRPMMTLTGSAILLATGIYLINADMSQSNFPQVLTAFVMVVISFLCALTLISNHTPRPDPPYEDINEDAGEQGLVQRLNSEFQEFMLFLSRCKRRTIIILMIATPVFAALVLFVPEFLSELIGFCVGFWGLVTGIVQICYSVQLRHTKTSGSVRFLVYGILSVTVAILLMLNPFLTMLNERWRILAGLYIAALGFANAAETLAYLFRWNIKEQRMLARIRFIPTQIFASFLPRILLEKYNLMLERNNRNYTYFNPEKKPGTEEYTDTELRVIFHFGRRVALGFGHVDIALNDTLYGYGCYDDASRRVMGLSNDGTFMVTKVDPFMDYCCRYQNKMFVSFSMRITKEQEQKIRSAIDEMLSTSVPWQPGPQNSVLPGKTGHLYKSIDVKYYKVTQGPYRIYSGFRTNCVAMAEQIVGRTGFQILPTNGIITPGTYYAFLERQLKLPDSPVIRKTVYSKNI